MDLAPAADTIQAMVLLVKRLARTYGANFILNEPIISPAAQKHS